MSHSQFSQGQHDGSNGLIEQMIRKEGNYREGIKLNQSHCNAFASSRLAKGSQLESLCEPDFLEQQRARLKQLTESNIMQGRELQSFVTALQKIGADENCNDYETALEAAMQKDQQTKQRVQLHVQQEPQYIELCSKLGESSGPTDDDLEVLPSEGGNTQQSLKCPIAGTLLEAPMRNKMCNHVYSDAAVRHYLKKGPKPCPIVGCRNQHITLQQLEPDMETEILVRREKKREEQRQRQFTQDAIDMDGEDDDDDEEQQQQQFVAPVKRERRSRA
jgi:hypothetical protein